MTTCGECGTLMHGAAIACPRCGEPQRRPDPTGPKWLDLRGRISRRKYWLHYMLPILAIDAIGDGVDTFLLPHDGINAITAFITLAPTIAGAVKRLHDRDLSGWWYLFGMIPVIGWIWLIVQNGFLRGTPRRNRFGADPRATRDYTLVGAGS